jgi:sepiapterin reductase
MNPQNAGSIGHIGASVDSPSLQDLRANVDLNITSALWLSVRFARHVRGTKDAPPCIIVQTSSLVAIKDFPSMAIYSAGKAARDKYHVVMAKEIGETANMKILNYAPGPLETDMVTEIRAAKDLDDSLRPHYAKEQLNPEDSANKLIQLLLSNDFESGAHIDYYDLPSNE